MDYEEEIIYEPLELPNRKRPLRFRVARGLAVGFVCFVAFILSLVAFYEFYPVENTDFETPEVSLECSYHPDGFFTVNITDAGDRKPGVGGSEYYLMDGNGTRIPGMYGILEEIYCRNMSYAQFNISFNDSNGDAGIGPGDSFIIRSVEGGGPADVGMIFELKFGRTGDTIGKVRLSKENGA